MDHIDEILRFLPNAPGVYQYFDEKGTIIYIGKAKSLKNRVNSYFHKEHISAKINMLVRKIADIKTIVVKTETDAFLLENNLIKKHKPRYNILLKDDKTYPWIQITNELLPRLIVTRRPPRDGSLLFGPFTALHAMHTLINMLKTLYPIRSCRTPMTQEGIDQGKYADCLNYQIKKCNAPCIGKQSVEEYRQGMDHIVNILKGNLKTVLADLRNRMMAYAEQMEFEKAQEMKERLEMLITYQSRSTIVSQEINNVDVCTIEEDNDRAYANFLRINSGAVVQSHCLELCRKLDESKEDMLLFAIMEFREMFMSQSPEIFVPFEVPQLVPNARCVVPNRGDGRKLLELSQRNLKQYIIDKYNRQAVIDPNRYAKRIVQQMQRDLELPRPPYHIECFDNSNTQGTNPVSSMVCFRDAKPSRKDYRHYNIKTVEGPDDFASMREVIYRRYKRLLDENQPLPDLILVDGGKGQLSAAVESLQELGIFDKVPILGIAKRLEDLFRPGDPYPLAVNKKSETQRVLQHLRDEAHRFGITHHRKRREKSTIKTELTSIKGVGPVIAEKLLIRFRSVESVRKAPFFELEALLGKAKAEEVYTYFHPREIPL